MSDADMPAGASGQSPVDLLIVGGGIMGLWAALKADRLGLSVLLVDQGKLGQGASGGVLGTLMAHAPERWNPKKQFQFDALIALKDEIVRLESETGLACGYRRCGRIIPLMNEHTRRNAERQAGQAIDNWAHPQQDLRWQVEDKPLIDGWPSANFAEYGLVHDTLAARVSPRQLTEALVDALRRAKQVRIVEEMAVVSLDPSRHEARLADGNRVPFGDCLVAAGHASFGLLTTGEEMLAKPLGKPVKGQAALLKVGGLEERPLIYQDGLYIVPHDDGIVAIGSTSENSFSAPYDTDDQLEALIARARALAPELADAPVVERWAGLRPKAIGRDPMVGRHPEHPRIVALTGGFKVSFGIAHKLADAALAIVAGQPANLPVSFQFSSHLELASRPA